MRQHVRARLEAAGLDIDAGIAILKRNLDATEYGLTKDGAVVEMGPDGTTQTRALEQLWKLHDVLPNPRIDGEVNISGAIVVMRPDDAVASADPFSANVIDVTPTD